MRCNQAAQRAFTLIELLAVVSIIALLIAILLPALSKARETTKNSQCQSNLRQLGVAQFAHAADNKAEFADSKVWVSTPYDPTEMDSITDGTLFNYVGDSPEIYLCPVAADVFGTYPAYQGIVRSYSQNHHIGDWPYFAGKQYNLDDIKRPSDLVVIGEENPDPIPGFSSHGTEDSSLNTYFWSSVPLNAFASFHNVDGTGDINSGNSNAVFADGSVTLVDYRGSHTASFTYTHTGTGVTEPMSRSTMWCRDDVINED